MAMKNNVLVSLFIIIVLACLAVGGMASITVIFKSLLYMIGVGALLFVGLYYMVNRLEEETQ